MAGGDQKIWDERHASKRGRGDPSPFLQQVFASSAWRIQPGKVLDIATGKGRNAAFLAERGFQVEAVDISEVALEQARKAAGEKGLSIIFRQADLDTVELPEAAYDLILNFNFLQRSLIPKVRKALKLGGHIVFETYLIEQRVLGHPRNPAHLLGHNELLELFRDFRVLYYREGKFVESGQEAYRAGLFGQKVK
ncbi:MAG: class I SAM-dependent methyltransferase [Deltaproteobacteria bacterium]|nr:class I SAM-dependent methyltransferase [Deltaproteobacteria bacterium]